LSTSSTSAHPEITGPKHCISFIPLLSKRVPGIAHLWGEGVDATIILGSEIRTISSALTPQ